jgi:predicted nucleotidyltransferase
MSMRHIHTKYRIAHEEVCTLFHRRRGNELRSLANEVMMLLAVCLPKAGIAVSGSVANGTASDDSDIDLLLVDESIGRNLQFVSFVHETRISILSLNPRLLSRHWEVWTHQFNSQHLSYIIDARIWCDPYGHLAKMRERASTIVTQIQRRDVNSIQNIQKQLEHAVSDVATLVSTDQDLQLMYRTLQSALSFWFIKNAVVLLTKATGHRSLNVVRKVDPESHRLLAKCIPLQPGSKSLLREYVQSLWPNNASLQARVTLCQHLNCRRWRSATKQHAPSGGTGQNAAGVPSETCSSTSALLAHNRCH